ncbi:hypothetical protein DXG01_001557 [Tephrocybe rancida]|nr:hypothetical protein DXG01_001557 [Tephrocybe rancida]
MAEMTTVSTASASLTDHASAPPIISHAGFVGSTPFKISVPSRVSTAAYNGYLDRGRKFITQLCIERRMLAVEDGIDTNVLESSLVGAPNRYSVAALELYVTKKCCDEGLSSETATGIQVAFLCYYNAIMGGQYEGPYHLDEDSGMVTGNPTHAPSFKHLVRAINAKSRNARSQVAPNRRNARAISGKELVAVINWSESVVSQEEVEAAIEYPPEDQARQALILKHARIQALFRYGFFVWTQNYELPDVRWEHM